jgi:2-amino-4-hydroxy-6-hydroxymethyldihydropteridine diphosphokinase
VIGYLGLGSNVGERRANLQRAVDALPDHGVVVVASSSVYDTEPVGEVLDQPEFLNACLRVETSLDPESLLDACKAVEVELGRATGGPRHGPRSIDVDVLLLGELEHSSERLRLPHAQVTSRRFVLVPLLELDPRLAAPGFGSLADALTALPGDEQAVRLAGPPLEVPSPLLRAFRAGYVESQDAFNRHDFETAFAQLPQDVEWRTVHDIPGVKDVMRGPAEVVAFFEEILETWPDWATQAESFEEPAPAVLLASLHAHATGRISGVPVQTGFVQVWDFRSTPVRVTEYRTRAEAVADLGL